MMPALPRLYLEVVDVRDVATAHIKAMVTPQAAGKFGTFEVFGAKYTIQSYRSRYLQEIIKLHVIYVCR